VISLVKASKNDHLISIKYHFMNRIFSGIQPSGDLHIGNYIGAIQQWVRHQNDYENYFCVVDLHAITVEQDPAALKKAIRTNIAWYLAAGLDPKKSVIFIQSHNPNHAELGWILNCFTSVGELNRMTQFKDKQGKNAFISAGLLDYPVLMAADILLYDADLVPVGDDQKQHIEITRDIAQRFNSRFPDTFTLPKYMPPLTGERIMHLQNPTAKMSKSDPDPRGQIYLSDPPDIIHQKITTAVTDSGNEIKIDASKPAVSNLLEIFIAFSGKLEEELSKEYTGKGYKKFKEDLAEVIIEGLKPVQKEYRELIGSPKLDTVLRDGLQSSRKITVPKLEKIKNLLGLG
jgi:tryptophanyl-tRNA synthetase